MRKIVGQLQAGIDEKVYTAANIEVARNGKVILRKAFWINDPRKPEKISTQDSVFDLASLTKVFVATAFLRMAEKKMVHINDQVSSIIPELKGDGKKEEITFRHLLSHSSWLPASFDLYTHGEWNQWKDRVMRKLFSADLKYDPGSQVVYSCLWFMLLGYAMERIRGLRLDSLLQEELFQPMGWRDISYSPFHSAQDRLVVTTFSRPNRGDLSPGIVHDGNAVALDGGISGNAGLFGTAEVVRQLGQSYLDGHVLSPGTIDLATSVHAEHEGKKRGLWWQLQSPDEANSGHMLSSGAYGHTGFTGTSLWVDPARKLVVSLLTNSVHFYTDKSDAGKFGRFRTKIHNAILSEIDDETRP